MHSRFPPPSLPPPPNVVYLSGKIHLHAKEGAGKECGGRGGFRRIWNVFWRQEKETGTTSFCASTKMSLQIHNLVINVNHNMTRVSS